MSAPRRHGLAVVAGVAAVLSFSPFDALPVGIAAYALLVHLWLSSTRPREAFLSGWWFGAGFFGAGVSWIYVSLSQFGGMPLPIAALATALFCAFLALFPALAGWLQAQVPASPLARAALAMPALWTLTEWLRGTVLTGFPWNAAGSAAPGWSYSGLAPVAGVYGCSIAILATAGLVAYTVRGERRAAAVAVAIAIFAGGEALRRVEWTAPEGRLEVSLLQGNIPQEMKFSPERYLRTIETYARLAEESRAPLVVLPETAIPRFMDLVDPAHLERFAAAARANRGDLLLGIPVRTSPESYLNSVVTLGTSPAQRYDKSHLVPFGEFVPPGMRWVMRQLQVPLSDFSRGTDRPRPLAVAGTRVAITVCYENAFGEELSRQLPEARLLVNLSNVAWFGDSLAPGQHLQLSRLRALETGRAHLVATNTGITAAIDRDGQVLSRLPQFVVGRLDTVAPLYSGATPYVVIGDALALALAGLMVAAALAPTWVRRRAAR